MPLLRLSNELLLQIASYLNWDSDINAFMQVSGRTYYLLTPWLYRHNIGWCDATSYAWAIRNGYASVVEKALDAGAWTNIDYGGFAGPLDLAIEKGYAEVLKVLLEKDIDSDPAWRIRSTSEEKLDLGQQSLLYKALSSCNKHVLQVLLSHIKKLQGYDVGRRARPMRGGWHTYGITVSGEAGEKLMRQVASKGDLDAVKFLARYLPSSINSGEEGRGETPIVQAVRNNHIEVLRFLLSAGADPGLDALYPEDTPLYHAASNGNAAAVQLLLDKGACPDPRMKYPSVMPGHSLEILEAAGINGHVKVAELLLKHIKVKSKMRGANKDRDALIITAATCGLTDLVQDIFVSGPKTYKKQPEGTRTFLRNTSRSTPLVGAINRGHKDIVALLIDHGVDVYQDFGDPPLIKAVSKGQTDIVQLLLDNGADLSHTRAYNLPSCYCTISNPCTIGFAALYHAVPFPSIFQLLLDRGAKPGDPMEKLTLVIEVVRLRSEKVAQLLMEHILQEASKDDSIADGEASGQPDKQAGGQAGKKPGNKSGKKESKKVRSVVQEVGLNSLAVRSIMSGALRNGDAAVVNYLLEEGFSPNHKWPESYNGETSSLEIAAEAPNRKAAAATLDVLLHHGADINQLQGNYWSPWSRNQDEKRYTSMKLLVERGADPVPQTSKWGRKVLKLAADARLKKTTRFLLYASCDRGMSLDDFEENRKLAEGKLRKGEDLRFEKVLEDAYWRVKYPVPKEKKTA